VLAAVIVVGAVLGGLLATSGARRGAPLPPASSTTSPRNATSSSTTAPPRQAVAIGTYQVASTSFDLVEPEGTAPARSLPTTVWYPATSGAGGLVADRAGAPYPLLVFSQGYDISVSAFEALIEDWASAGFVVAGPTYPHTDPSDLAALDEGDIVEHPADLRFVIGAVLERAQEPGGVLSGLVDPGEIGLAGHSDGGDVTLAVADNSCCRDARVKAAAVLSGAELAAFGGSYFTGPQVPLLVVQGTADTINPPGCSVQIYDAAAAPKSYLDLLGAGHAPPYVDPGPYQQVVAKVTTDFFEATLQKIPAAARAMAGAGDVAGVSELSDGPTAPLAPSGCPGAPG
jgi:predicted dienelactone hydrolase